MTQPLSIYFARCDLEDTVLATYIIILSCHLHHHIIKTANIEYVGYTVDYLLSRGKKREIYMFLSVPYVLFTVVPRNMCTRTVCGS